jgi:hypothetical protein
MAGGTFRRWERIVFWRWKRTYSGHLTKRVRSVLCWMSWPSYEGEGMRDLLGTATQTPSIPMPKFLGRDSKSGFLTCLVDLPAAPGARAGVLPVPFFGGWSSRRETVSERVQACGRATPRTAPALMTRSSNARRWPASGSPNEPSRDASSQGKDLHVNIPPRSAVPIEGR